MSILAGKVAVIAGAGSAIGRAVARLFAASGARVLVNDLGTDVAGRGSDPAVVADLACELSNVGERVLAHSGDVSTEAGVESLMSLAVSELGGVDILVNCVGILRERALLNMHARDLSAVLDVHVLGTFRLMQAAASIMRDRGGGRIVNTTHQAALLGNIGQCANSSASAAVIGLTRSAAVELLRHRIYVNAVAPLAKTRQTEALPLFQKATSLTPEHAAVAYLFLASDLAGETSGEVLSIAGNRLSALGQVEREAVFSEAASGRFDLQELARAWHRLMA